MSRSDLPDASIADLIDFLRMHVDPSRVVAEDVMEDFFHWWEEEGADAADE